MEPPSKVWSVDFEYRTDNNFRPTPICLVAREIFSGELRRVWLWGDPPSDCPIDFTGSLYVAYAASAEMSCHLALGWVMPECIVDLHAEYCAEKAGLLPQRKGLLYALSSYGITAITAGEKNDMRDLCIRGGPYTEKQREEILTYCQSDVDVTAELFLKMWPRISGHLSPALWRGEYGKAVAKIEANGIPLDVPKLEHLRAVWPRIKAQMIHSVDARYGVFEGETFKAAKFEAWVKNEGIDWPLLESGRLDLKERTFSDMSKREPRVHALHELRKTLSELRLQDIPVGADNRNRFAVMPYQSKTGRNQPKGKEFIFSGAKWLRHLIRPEPGMAVAYIDWSGQEFGIAAYKSGDANMIAAYESGDPHLFYAKLAGAVPQDATKDSHPNERKVFKIANLGILMGMGVRGLSLQIGNREVKAAQLLRSHKEIFPDYWQWSEDNLNHYLDGHALYGAMGWPLNPSLGTKTTTARNFKLQANGAEMMRLAAIAITAKGIRVCCPVHDAFLVEAPVGEIDEVVESVQVSMAEASSVVLGGPHIRTDVDIFRYPGRYKEKDGEAMWELVNGLADILNEGAL
jgi:DNA polymerase I